MEGLVKSAKRQFDSMAFLAKVGTGKAIQKYRKGRIIYTQGQEADQIFYIQARQRSRRRHLGRWTVFWRGMSAWADAPRWNREVDAGVRYHLHHPEGDAGDAPQRTQICGAFHDVPGDPEQSH